MRCLIGLGSLMGLLLVADFGWTDTPVATRSASLAERYGIHADLRQYPQGSPQETIRSVIKATKANRIDYMLAHLISPKQVDEKLKGNVEAMKALAAKATPEKSNRMVRSLEIQLNEGTWTIERDLAWSRRPGMRDLSLERIGKHWFMHNTPMPTPEATPSAESKRP